MKNELNVIRFMRHMSVTLDGKNAHKLDRNEAECHKNWFRLVNKIYFNSCFWGGFDSVWKNSGIKSGYKSCHQCEEREKKTTLEFIQMI